MTNASISIAFIAGILSFISPCVLPLIPSYISYITGITLKDFSKNEDRAKIRKITIINSLLFILGFSLVFIAMGAAASLLGQFIFQYKNMIRIVGGIIIILLGLYIMGVFKLRFLDVERRFNIKTKPAGYLGSLLVGFAFAAAWIPCVGPILGSILLLAGTTETLGAGMVLLTSYSLGLGIPFFITSLAVNSALVYFRKIEKYMRLVTTISGVFLVLVGILILTNYFQSITTYLIDWTGFGGI